MKERIRVSALREVTAQGELAGTEALLGPAEQHPVPHSSGFQAFWKAVGFFLMPAHAHLHNRLTVREW